MLWDLLGSGVHDWDLWARMTSRSEPVRLRRGRVMGGSGSVNSGIFLRGVPDDYDRWARAGNPGWSWADVEPSFRRLESDHDFAGEDHGDAGPIPVRRLPPGTVASQDAFPESALAAGMPPIDDFNAPDAAGVGPLPMDLDGRRRVDAATAYLAPGRRPSGLTVLADREAHQLLFDGQRCVGVSARQRGATRELRARETILCAGAVGSPELLLRSGIGPADELRRGGIAVVHDSPGVGRNLRCHPNAPIVWRATAAAALDPRNPDWQYAIRSVCPGSSTPHDMMVYMCSRASLPGSPSVSPDAIRMHAVLNLEASSGALSLNPARPDGPPMIDFGFLSQVDASAHGGRPAERCGPGRLARSRGRDRQSHLRDGTHGPRDRSAGRRGRHGPRPRRGRAAGRGRLDHARLHPRQHQRHGDDDRRARSGAHGGGSAGEARSAQMMPEAAERPGPPPATAARNGWQHGAPLPGMSSRARLVLLGALCAGALLVGIELLITAVALPRIVADLGDWTQLRRASWIVNGYLLSYVATMPLAGRAADHYGLTRLFMVALAVFAVGSLLSGVAQTLDQLIVARLLQGVGAGAILPLATAGASQLYEGHGRARALGVVGACTFLGMAIGPFLGATILDAFELRPAFIAAGMANGTIADLVTPSWRWVFLLGAPLALVALSYVWAASPQGVDARTPARIDATGAMLFTLALASGLLTFSALGEPQADAGSIPIPALAALVCLLATALAVRHMLRAPDPFVDPELFRDRIFSGAVLVSLLTGYALATAIIGAAVYVDRVRYAGPEEQRIVLGTLAIAMAAGALGSGLALRFVRIVPLSLAGLAVAIGGMAVLATLDAATPLGTLLLGVGVFGLGFGVTVTPRSTAAVEALGRRAFGVASAGVTVARTMGMAIGLAVLTGVGTQRIEALSRVLTDQAERDAVLPSTLRGRALLDPLVIGELERWAAREAASILAGLFAVAGIVLAAAIAPTLLMNARSARPGRGTIDPDGSGDEGPGPALAL